MSLISNTIGGTLWLNFLNTRRYSEGKIVDLLEQPDDFNKWLKDNGYENLSEEILLKNKHRFQDLREVLFLLAKHPDNETELAALTEIIEQFPVKFAFSLNKGTIRYTLDAYYSEDEFFVKIIKSIIGTFETYGLVRVRQCAHESCILFFLDTSKGGRRKWCDMGTCGNREKASKHYRKKKLD